MAVNRPKSTSSLQSASLLASLTNSMESAEAFDVGDTKVQHYGLLMKKPFGHKSARWQKRLVSLIYHILRSMSQASLECHTCMCAERSITCIEAPMRCILQTAVIIVYWFVFDGEHRHSASCVCFLTASPPPQMTHTHTQILHC